MMKKNTSECKYQITPLTGKLIQEYFKWYLGVFALTDIKLRHLLPEQEAACKLAIKKMFGIVVDLEKSIPIEVIPEFFEANLSHAMHEMVALGMPKCKAIDVHAVQYLSEMCARINKERYKPTTSLH